MSEEIITNEKYLEKYNPETYESPSVAVDILIFSMNNNKHLELLLVKRAKPPFMGQWSIPGGFVDMKESIDDTALRKLKEKTGLEGIYLEQLYTFGAVERDIRKRVISIAYIALVPAKQLNFKAGKSTSDACLFEIIECGSNVKLYSTDKSISIEGKELAFDHEIIIRKAIERLRGKVNYTDIALELLRDKQKFSIYELQTIFETILGEKVDVSNFRRWFLKKFYDTQRVIKLEEKCVEYSKKPSSYYKLVDSGTNNNYIK